MMALQQATEIVHGEMHGDNVSFASISTDSRQLKPGDLYIALQGERFDGHDFIQQAQELAQWQPWCKAISLHRYLI